MDEALDLRTRLNQRLRAAMRARDVVTTAALRSVSAAIANAEAVDVPEPARADPRSDRVTGAVGVGAAETARRELSDDDLTAIVTAEADERKTAAQTYATAGHADRSEKLRQEAVIIRGLITA